MTDPIPAYRRRDLPTEDRVRDLLQRMTPSEKLGQLNVPLPLPPGAVAALLPGVVHPSSEADLHSAATGHYLDGVGPVGGFFAADSYGNEGGPRRQAELRRRLQQAAASTRLGIPLVQIIEGTHGVQATGATIFPEGPGLGSTWNPDLIRDVYAAVAREARSIGNHLLCTLVVEPIRDPRLGRSCQGYSEDSYLTGRMARAIVAGAQGDDVADPHHAGVILCHFPGQSEPVAGMERGAMEVSERVLRETFLPPWAAVSGPHGALGVMATYATIDGLPVHGHTRWLTDVLRGELGFTGVVVSEGFGFETLQYEGVVETQAQAGAMALQAGVDISMTWEEAFRQPLTAAVAGGTLDGGYLDRAVARILAVKFALGLFDDAAGEDDEAGTGDVGSPAHRELALRAAHESIVLLKNDGALLPLDGAAHRVAVIGPNADDARSLLGDYVASTVSQPVPSILAVLRERLGDSSVTYARGCDITDPGDADIDAAVRAAAAGDVAVVVLGERPGELFFADPPATVGERYDVQSLDLSGRQQELLEAVHATGTPVVLVLVNGRPLSVRWAAAHVPAIVEAWFPGERGAEAVVDVLLGAAHPSGRLSVTVPRSVGQLPAYYNAKPSRAYWLGQGGYADTDAAGPLYPFGHGLTYTRFEYDDLTVTAHRDGEILARVGFRVRNAGERPGTETPQLYIGDRFSSTVTPGRQLRGFARISLPPGHRERVSFDLTAADLALLDRSGRWVAEAGVFDVMVGASSADIRLSGEFALDSDVPIGPVVG